MIRQIFLVAWLVLALVVGLYADLWHSYGMFYPLFVLLCSPPLMAVAALISGRLRATAQVRQRVDGLKR